MPELGPKGKLFIQSSQEAIFYNLRHAQMRCLTSEAPEAPEAPSEK